MEYFFGSFYEALRLILSLDEEVMRVSIVSIKVSLGATLISTIIGIPVGFIIAYKRLPWKRLIQILLNTMMAIPTVTVGLLVYGLLARKGPFGGLGLLYTPWAMMIGQTILATPIITGLSLSALQGIDKRVLKEAKSLGASSLQLIITILSHSRLSLLGAVTAGFGRVFTEVGVSMMLGGNIVGYTRNLPTAIALETQKGEFAMGMALGLILLSLALIVNTIFYLLYGRMG